MVSAIYTIAVRKKFSTLKGTSERHTPNDKYEHFATVLPEVAAKWIPTKLTTKARVHWESIAVREKRDNMKKHSYFIYLYIYIYIYI